MDYTLRQAFQGDLKWLEPFYEDIMRPYVELTHEWNENKFREVYDPSISYIIEIDGEHAGFLKWAVRENHIFLGDIQLRQEYRNKGLGTQIIRSILKEAETKSLPVRLRVLKGNPVRDLYIRLGFREFAELDNCFELVWSANNPVEATA